MNAAHGDGADQDSKPPSRTTTTATSNTCLGKAGLTLEKEACNTCMNADACCQAAIGCFDGYAACNSLPQCMSACGGGTTGSGPSAGDGGAGGTTNSAPKNISVAEVYPAVSGTCAACHNGAGAGPKFFDPTADESYLLFKGSGYDGPNRAFVQKDAHAGPALSTVQRALVDKWTAAEATGSGGGGGGDAGDGGAGTGAGKLACQNARKTSTREPSRSGPRTTLASRRPAHRRGLAPTPPLATLCDGGAR